MKIFLKLSLGMVFGVWGLLAMSPTPVASAQGDRICVYAHTNYRGRSICWNVGESVPDFGRNGLGDKTSSIRVFGRAKAIVYKDKNYRGESLEISSDIPNLKNLKWNDRISAIKVVGSDWSDYNQSRVNWPDYNRPDGDRICGYANKDYRGRSICWNVGESVPDFGRTGWGDQISSIRVFGRAKATVYNDKNYRGESLEISSDIPNLRSFKWDDRISAIKVVGSDWSDYNQSRVNWPDYNRPDGRLPDYNRPGGNGSGSGRMTWSGRVDDEVEILVRRNETNVRTVSGAATYTERASFSSPLPWSDAPVQVRRIRGRGLIEVVQQAGRGNDYTAIVRIRDEKSGGDNYEFELTW